MYGINNILLIYGILIWCLDKIPNGHLRGEKVTLSPLISLSSMVSARDIYSEDKNDFVLFCFFLEG